MRQKLIVVCMVLFLAVSFLSFLDLMPPAQAVFGAEDIFFEYGAESGVLQPPFDIIGAKGSGSTTGTYTQIDSTHVHAGDYAILIHQPSGTKSDAQRRVVAQYYSHSQTDFYFSFWFYFPSGYDTMVDDGYRPTLGGLTLYWYDIAGVSSTHKGLRFRFVPRYNATGVYVRPTWSGVDDSSSSTPVWSTSSGDKWGIGGARPWVWDGEGTSWGTAFVDTWNHVQLYMKVSTNENADGQIKGWVNDNVVIDKANIPTNPAYWGFPLSGGEYGHNLAGPYYMLNLEQYGSTSNPYSVDCWFDDVVGATEKVPESYTVTYPSSEFGGWANGFEDGDDTFPKWNGTSLEDGEANISSTVKYSGSYSANLTTTSGDSGSKARLLKQFQPVDEIYMRAWVRVTALPDTANTEIMVLRLTNGTEDYQAIAGFHKHASNGSFGFTVNTFTGQWLHSYAIHPVINTWYCLELYFKATVSGNVTLWVNGQNIISDAGTDYSGRDQIARAYPQIYMRGTEASGKTVFIDDFKVDDEYIGMGTTKIFQVSFYVGTEQTPLENVMINGTYPTDASGYYEWSNLTYDQIYVFVVEKPSGYYPAWVLNVEGSYSWNGTHYLLSHNVTEAQTGYLQIYFLSTTGPYINYTNAKLMSTSYSNNTMYVTVNHTNSREINIYSTDRPTYLLGKNYSSTDYASNIFNITYTYSGSKTWIISYEDFDSRLVYSSQALLSTVSYSSPVMSVTANDTGRKTLEIYSTARPTYVKGKSYALSDYASNLFNVTYTFSGSKTFDFSWANFGGVTISSTTGEVTSTPTLVSDVLIFQITKASGTSVTEVYVGSKGTPNKVSGASSWSYNDASKILSLQATHASAVDFTVSWLETSSGINIEGGDLSLMTQYLLQGDIIGFVLGCYLLKMGMAFYGLVLLMFTGIFYNRTKSVAFISVMWLVLGGTFELLTWVFSPLAVLLIVFGLVGVIYSLFEKEG